MSAREDFPALGEIAQDAPDTIALMVNNDAHHALDEIDTLRAQLAQAVDHLREIIDPCDDLHPTHCGHGRLPCAHRAARAWLDELGGGA